MNAVPGNGRELLKMLVVGMGSALVSGIGVGLTFLIMFSTRNATLEARQESNIKSIEQLTGSVGRLEELFRSQLQATTQLSTRLDAYLEALRNQPK